MRKAGVSGLQRVKSILLRRQVQKNLSRGMSISEIAEVLDETEGADPGDSVVQIS